MQIGAVLGRVAAPQSQHDDGRLHRRAPCRPADRALSYSHPILEYRTHMQTAATQLAIVVPCFNEEDALRVTCAKITALLGRLLDQNKISDASRLYFVDDGSGDRTWSIVDEFVQNGLPVIGIKLSANRGHQNALLAGLLYAKGDAIVSIDADLQDDVGAIEAMVDRFHAGWDVVYGVRKNRGSDGFFKRFTAVCFYRLMTSLGARTIHNHADCRLMSRRAVEALREFRETALFLRGIVPLIGFRSTTVEYARLTRHAENPNIH